MRQIISNAALFLMLCTTSAFANKDMQPITQMLKFVCKDGCQMKCWGAGGDLNATYREAVVHQFAVQPTRLWVRLDDATKEARTYVLGVDQTCNFEGDWQVGGIGDTPLPRPTPSPVPPTILK